ncbi:MAG: arsenite methyltransferase [Nitrospirae bacterium]|nr:arsenite methyltransferase [Nitrospirota bacterium]
MKRKETIKIVREAYGKIAQGKDSCGCGTCGPDAREFARSIGYSEEELKAIPDEANLALSCGNPISLASLKKGETVLDLGSGAGFDCFLAADKVGSSGKIIGVDMTAQMIEKARDNAKKNRIKNVEFRIGEIEDLPVADNSVDAVISNCVINLSPDKQKVFHEIYRVLKPGGRVAISDIALNKKLPDKVRESINAYVGCVSGAILVDEYERTVRSSGLKDIKITSKGTTSCIDPDTKDPIGRAILDNLEDGQSLEEYVVSINIEARKQADLIEEYPD